MWIKSDTEDHVRGESDRRRFSVGAFCVEDLCETSLPHGITIKTENKVPCCLKWCIWLWDWRLCLRACPACSLQQSLRRITETSLPAFIVLSVCTIFPRLCSCAPSSACAFPPRLPCSQCSPSQSAPSCFSSPLTCFLFPPQLLHAFTSFSQSSPASFSKLLPWVFVVIVYSEPATAYGSERLSVLSCQPVGHVSLFLNSNQLDFSAFFCHK